MSLTLSSFNDAKTLISSSSLVDNVGSTPSNKYEAEQPSAAAICLNVSIPRLLSALSYLLIIENFTNNLSANCSWVRPASNLFALILPPTVVKSIFFVIFPFLHFWSLKRKYNRVQKKSKRACKTYKNKNLFIQEEAPSYQGHISVLQTPMIKRFAFTVQLLDFSRLPRQFVLSITFGTQRQSYSPGLFHSVSPNPHCI